MKTKAEDEELVGINTGFHVSHLSHLLNYSIDVPLAHVQDRKHCGGLMGNVGGTTLGLPGWPLGNSDLNTSEPQNYFELCYLAQANVSAMHHRLFMPATGYSSNTSQLLNS